MRRLNPNSIKKHEVTLAAGGFGKVYSGIYQEGRRKKHEVAIKSLKSLQGYQDKKYEQERKTFMREIEIYNLLASLNDSDRFFLKFYGETILDDKLSIVLEYILLGSLDDQFKGPLLRQISLPLRLRIAYDVISGLDYLHNQIPERSIVHRDLKAANVLLRVDWHAVIVDFGISLVRHKNIVDEEGDTQVNDPEHRQICGTYLWGAPEQIDSYKHCSHKSDLYSFGKLLWYLFFGNITAIKRSLDEVGFQSVSAPGSLYPQLRKAYNQIAVYCLPGNLEEYFSFIRECLRKNYRERPETAELKERIGSLLAKNEEVQPILLPVMEANETIESSFSGSSYGLEPSTSKTIVPERESMKSQQEDFESEETVVMAASMVMGDSAEGFLKAVRAGNLQALQRLCNRGTNLAGIEQDGNDALYLAIMDSAGTRLDVISWLLSPDGPNISLNKKYGQYARTPFLLAAELGNLPLLKFFKESGVLTDQVDAVGFNALHLAAYCLKDEEATIDVVAWLLDPQGGNIPIDSIGGIDEKTPFLLAVEQGNYSLLQFFEKKIRNMPNALKVFEKTDARDLNALHLAVLSLKEDDSEKRFEIVQWLLKLRSSKRPIFDVNAKGGFRQYTAFLFAVKIANLKCAKYLVEDHDALHTAEDSEKCNALHIACLFPAENDAVSLSLLEWLFSRLPKLEALDMDGCTPFLSAIQGGSLSVLKFLWGKKKSVSQAKDFDHFNALHHFVYAASTDIDMLDWLIDPQFGGLSLEDKDREGRTPFSLAAHLGRGEALFLLLKRNALPNEAQKEGYTPFQLALPYVKHFNVVDFFLMGIEEEKVSASIEKAHEGDNRTQFLYAAAGGVVGFLENLKKRRAKIEKTDANGFNAFHMAACYHGTDQTIAYLKKIGVKYVKDKKHNRGAFLYAAGGCNLSALNGFLSAGLVNNRSIANERDIRGDNVLHRAAKGHCFYPVAALLNQSDLLKVRNKYNETPLDLFRQGEKSHPHSFPGLKKINKQFLGLKNFDNSFFSGVQLGSLKKEEVIIKEFKRFDRCAMNEKALFQETSFLKRLNHEHIVSVRGSFVENAKQYIVMHYGSAHVSLASFLFSSGVTLSNQKKSLLAYSISKGLDYLHSQGVVHANLRPETVMLDNQNHCIPKLADFGLSATYTMVSKIRGVDVDQALNILSYMSPKIIALLDSDLFYGNKTSDIYSLGATLYALVTAARPYSEAKDLETLVTLKENKRYPFPQSLENAPEKLCSIILKSGLFAKRQRSIRNLVIKPKPLDTTEILKTLAI